MQQNYRNTRYNVSWDCSNQYKRYTNEEKRLIENCMKNNMNSIEIAKLLKRGLWPIEVQIMYLKQNNHNDNDNYNNNNFSTTNNYNSTRQPKQYLHKQKTQKQQSMRQTNCMQRKNRQANRCSNIQRYYELNRKFEHTESQKIIKTGSTLIRNHVSELMGL